MIIYKSLCQFLSGGADVDRDMAVARMKWQIRPSKLPNDLGRGAGNLNWIESLLERPFYFEIHNYMDTGQ